MQESLIFLTLDVQYAGVNTGAVDGYDATGEPTADPRVLTGGIININDPGYDGSNPSLGANNAAFIQGAAASLADNAERIDRTAYTLSYTAGSGGSVTLAHLQHGASDQVVYEGADASPVTATASPGYTFSSWSDGSAENPRTDTNVQADLSFQASFTQNSITDPIDLWFPLDETSGTSVTEVGGLIAGEHSGFSDSEAAHIPGKYGYALNFDGVDAQVELPGITLPTGNDLRTISAWVRVSDTSVIEKQVIFGYGTESDGQRFGFRLDTKTPEQKLRLEVRGGFILGTTKINDGNWHHVAVVVDDFDNSGILDVDEVKLYVDGVEENVSDSASQAINTSDEAIPLIGASSHAANCNFKGDIDELRITNSALSANEISALMNAINVPESSYTLSYTASSGGSVSGESNQEVLEGADGTPVTATASAGYTFNSWSDGSTENPRTDTAVSANLSVQASFTQNSNTDPTDLWFPLDETSGTSVTDVGGVVTGYHSGFSDSEAAHITGKHGYALSFDGVDDQVSLSGVTLPTGNSERTISAWVRVSATSGVEKQVIFGYGTNNNGQRFSFRLDGIAIQRLRLEVQGGSIVGTTQINDGDWHHVAVVVDDFDNSGITDVDEVKLYVDGVLETVSSSSSEPINTSSTAIPFIGGSAHATNCNFKGDIDELRVTNSALSATEINTQMVAVNTATELWFPFDETSGASVTEAGGVITGSHSGFSDSETAHIIGKHGYALNFDGVNDHVELSGITLPTGASARTISAWVRVSANTPDVEKQVIFGYGIASSSGQRFSFRLDTNTTEQKLRLEVGGGYILGTTQINDGEWHHVAVVVDDFDNSGTTDVNEVRLYVDGVLETVSSSASEPINTSGEGQALIGASDHDPGFNFMGDIDELRITYSALTETEIRTQMNPVTAPTDLWFPLNETSGTSVSEAGGFIAGEHFGFSDSEAAHIPGKHGYALSFDGDDDQVKLSGITLPTGNSARTVSAWVRVSATSGVENQVIFGYGTDSNGQRFSFHLDGIASQRLRLEVKGGYIVGTTQINDGNWHHVAVVVDDFDNSGTTDVNEVRLYVDGALETVSSSASEPINTSGEGEALIGASDHDPGFNFMGDIDELRITNSALSATEISTQMNAMTGFAAWVADNGLTGATAGMLATPQGDGISNLVKYAFNIDPSLDGHITLLPSSGSSGLPYVSRQAIGTGRLTIEYLRRKSATDISYTVQFSENLSSPPAAGSWAASVSEVSVTEIDADWERVIVEDLAIHDNFPNRFVRVKIDFLNN